MPGGGSNLSRRSGRSPLSASSAASSSGFFPSSSVSPSLAPASLRFPASFCFPAFCYRLRSLASGKCLFSLFPPGFPPVPHYLSHTSFPSPIARYYSGSDSSPPPDFRLSSFGGPSRDCSPSFLQAWDSRSPRLKRHTFVTAPPRTTSMAPQVLVRLVSCGWELQPAPRFG
jgi:hypothetical protein